jgi:hypothetical protein
MSAFAPIFLHQKKFKPEMLAQNSFMQIFRAKNVGEIDP